VSIPLNDNGRHRKTAKAQNVENHNDGASSPSTVSLTVRQCEPVHCNIESYELKPGMFAKATQVDLDPLTSLHSVEKLLTCTSKNGVTGALAHTATPRGNFCGLGGSERTPLP